MAKVKQISDDGRQKQFAFYCPGCQSLMQFPVPPWAWNLNAECPTVHPSLKIEGRCHVTVTDGQLIFSEWPAHLTGQVLPMEEIEPHL
jgi:hypothetical protein